MMSEPKYAPGDLILHHERNSVYRVLATPRNYRLRTEKEWVPGYAYEDVASGAQYGRAQAHIEDEARYTLAGKPNVR